MTDKASVRLILSSDIEGEKQEHHFHGEWYRKGRTVYVRYSETDEEAGETRTLIRWRDGELHIARRGLVDSEQTFVAGVRRTGRYASPFVQFQMETDTEWLWMQCGNWRTDGERSGAEPPHEGDKPIDGELLPDLPMLLEWHYKMYVDGELTGQFKIKLQAERN
ncbi:DUF1934 domain-containing protein [Paenibacillus sp. MMS18-CY102]|uniref:DUF1934 domain-containing protein n=1 Tax=Paenibacillus sp. MMS18-CY102 TaxID=2682849 RepID=UPI0013651FD7|nr:DUF1934 domain-containing protein [Paenibacillus sp. MMS18-CY102]MWC31066.1 DUF1934 family protein [Paenibacillus sp. MMS18-CY102]